MDYRELHKTTIAFFESNRKSVWDKGEIVSRLRVLEIEALTEELDKLLASAEKAEQNKKEV
jgi:hypothetical protein